MGAFLFSDIGQLLNVILQSHLMEVPVAMFPVKRQTVLCVLAYFKDAGVLHGFRYLPPYALVTKDKPTVFYGIGIL